MVVIPMLKTADIAKAPAVLAKYMEDPNQEPIILMFKRKPVAVILPAQGRDVETISLSLSPEFHALMERSRQGYERDGGFSDEEIRREFGLPPYQEKPKRKPRKKKAANRKRRTGTDGRQV
jgi:hypothetical protein